MTIPPKPLTPALGWDPNTRAAWEAYWADTAEYEHAVALTAFRALQSIILTRDPTLAAPAVQKILSADWYPDT